MDNHRIIRNVSNLFYHKTNNRIGSEEVIRNRRMVDGILRKLIMTRKCAHDHLDSGSRAEGFFFNTSDVDEMMVYRYIKVLTNDNSSDHCIQNEAELIMETDQTRPGFCLLRLVYLSNVIEMALIKSLVPFQSNIYLSSALWRNEVQKILPQSNSHGPCESDLIAGTEHDIAHCLKCTKWPKLALPCITRLKRGRWPSNEVLEVIVRNGCHLVPIGDKVSEKDIMEWRISFSEAEKLLIHNMNHCQFLCYGLLKIFLKENIDTREEVSGLLCSYFLKTAVFWEISFNRTTWTQENFVLQFWDCFRRLISWVIHGYCPNFFIPENNMILGKIFGRSQRILIDHLTSLYNQGYMCIPVCKCDFCMSVLSYPNLIIFEPSWDFYEKAREDVYLCIDIFNKCPNITDFNHHELYKEVILLQNMRSRSKSNTEFLTIDIFLHCKIQLLFLSFTEVCFSNMHSTCNRGKYELMGNVAKALKRSKIDMLFHNVLLASLMYKLGMYQYVRRFIMNVNVRVHQQFIISDSDEYIAAGGETTSFAAMIRKFSVFVIGLNLMHIPELYLELVCSKFIYGCPAIVYLNCLLYLSNYRLSKYDDNLSVLHDLESLIKDDNSKHISRRYKAISWEILGICQEMSGHIGEAFISFYNALSDPCGSHFREATLARIKNLNWNI